MTIRKRTVEGRTLAFHLYWPADGSVSGKELFYLGYVIHLNSCVSVESKYHTDNSEIQFWRLRVSILVNIHSKVPQLKLNLKLFFCHITCKLDWTQWISSTWNLFRSFRNYKLFSSSVKTTCISKSRNSYTTSISFFCSAGNWTHFSGKCSASRYTSVLSLL